MAAGPIDPKNLEVLLLLLLSPPHLPRWGGLLPGDGLAVGQLDRLASLVGIRHHGLYKPKKHIILSFKLTINQFPCSLYWFIWRKKNSCDKNPRIGYRKSGKSYSPPEHVVGDGSGVDGRQELGRRLEVLWNRHVYNLILIYHQILRAKQFCRN